jgi:hexosaminidase
MKVNRSYLGCFGLLYFCLSMGGFVFAQPNIFIPQPQEVRWRTGPMFNLNEAKIVGSTIFPNEVAFLQQGLQKRKLKSLVLATSPSPEQPAITFIRGEFMFIEAYELEIAAHEIRITAASPEGAFYAVVSLLQLCDGFPNFKLPQLHLIDEPAYSWRGMHLDCSRHFFTVAEVKRYIDYLAMYKMNVFHWHLTDDQGWRAEIKAYPLLTEVGGWRKETLIGRPSADMKYDGQKYGGYYTQADMKEVVAYASARHITVVPEIEMPGHALAALSAYPQYSCTGGPFETGRSWGVFDDVFCAGNESTFMFLQTILDEIIGIFPSTYIHVGGDECPKVRWKACAKCQQRMQKEDLKDEHALQSYFITRMENYLNTRKRKLIGWDEILEGGLAPYAAVMSWRGTEGGIAAAKSGHYAVMSPGKPCYFDHYQSEDRSSEPLAIGGFNSVEAVYAYRPTPAELGKTEAQYILGAQGNVWTEYMPSFNQVSYMAMPRLLALSEVLWTNPETKNYPNFLLRLKQHCDWLDKQSIPYGKHALTQKP